jgi:SAM-dependent methyltransferase
MATSSSFEFGTTAHGLHDRVLELIEDLPRGSLLDAPAGEGRLSMLLKNKGFSPTAGDIDPSSFKLDDVTLVTFDMNGKFPFEDEEFDHAVCIEGVEHIENTFHLAREMSRIIKKNGVFIISTPNIMSIYSRLRNLLIGYPSFFGGYYRNKDHFYTYHINPAGLPQLHLAITRAGFSIERVATNRKITAGLSNPLSRLIVMLLLPLVRIFSARHDNDDPVDTLLCSEDILLGECIILKCKKK